MPMLATINSRIDTVLDRVPPFYLGMYKGEMRFGPEETGDLIWPCL